MFTYLTVDVSNTGVRRYSEEYCERGGRDTLCGEDGQRTRD